MTPEEQGLMAQQEPGLMARLAEWYGNTTFVKPAVDSMVSAATLPGDVYAGRVDPRSDEAIERSADLAGLAMTGGLGGVAKEGGMVLGSGPIRRGGKLFDFGNPGGGSRIAKVGDTEITYGVGKNGIAEVILVKTPEAKRGEGSARRAMEQFLAEADEQGYRVALTAEPMGKGVSKSKLENFYKSLGFKPNTGKNKDFDVMSGMIRNPRSRNTYGEGGNKL